MSSVQKKKNLVTLHVYEWICLTVQMKHKITKNFTCHSHLTLIFTIYESGLGIINSVMLSNKIKNPVVYV